jgi:hypothetical protein
MMITAKKKKAKVGSDDNETPPIRKGVLTYDQSGSALPGLNGGNGE